MNLLAQATEGGTEEGKGRHAEGPVDRVDGRGDVRAGVFIKAEDVLEGEDRPFAGLGEAIGNHAVDDGALLDAKTVKGGDPGSLFPLVKMLEIGKHGVVIVGAKIADGIDGVEAIAMQDLGVVEREFDDVHAGEIVMVAEDEHLGTEVAEVLGDDAFLEVRVFTEEGIEEFVSGGLDPGALDRGRAGRGDLPERVERAEMVEADDVIDLGSTKDAFLQEGVIGGFEVISIVDRVAPELAGRGEIIGRDAGDEGR